MTRSARIHAGAGECREALVAGLAVRLRDAAKALGFRVSHILCSRSPGSPSRYIKLHDAHGRLWFVRVSNHRRPWNNCDRQDPHLDFVSFDGTSGFDQAVDWLARVWTGGVDWFDPRRGRPRRR